MRSASSSLFDEHRKQARAIHANGAYCEHGYIVVDDTLLRLFFS